MQFSYLLIFQSPKTQKYRVMMVGQPDEHIMNWRGCNYRRMALPTNLKKNFADLKEAYEYLTTLEGMPETMAKIKRFAKLYGDGSWFPESEGVFEPKKTLGL